jgi:hypothetical protein
MINIGVDSCPGGWIAVIYTPFLKHYKIAKTFLEKSGIDSKKFNFIYLEN